MHMPEEIAVNDYDQKAFVDLLNAAARVFGRGAQNLNDESRVWLDRIFASCSVEMRIHMAPVAYLECIVIPSDDEERILFSVPLPQPIADFRTIM
jgi:hypothetical protein